VIGPEQLAAGERAELAGDYLAAGAAYRAVAALPDEALAADAHFHLGRLAWRQGRLDAAAEAFESARVLAERADDTELHARVENGIGAVQYARGDFAAARRAYAAASARTHDDAMRGKIVLNLGVIENTEGNFAEAHAHYDRAYELLQRSGDRASAALALHNRGMVEVDLARWEEADASFVASLALSEETDNREMVAKTLVNRSAVLVERLEMREAIALCDRAIAIYGQVGDEVGRGEALRWRAHALGRAGEHLEAERNAAEAMHIAVRSGARLLEAESARDLGVLRGLLGDRAGATKLLRRALALFTELGARREAVEVGTVLQRPTPARSLARIEPDETL
jgi:tetratricopeptide (TPR) repeat protein